MFTRNIIIASFCVLITACASTSLTDSWKDTDQARNYQHPLIIGISDSQQTRQIYEKHFVAGLKKINITSTPSYKLISSKQKINRETVIAAVQGTDIEIDSVLVTYLVSADSEMKHRESPMNQGYSGSNESHQISDTIVSNRGQSRNEEVYVLKSDLYDVQSRALVWSARTRSVGPESVDQVVEEVVELLIKEMLADELLIKR